MSLFNRLLSLNSGNIPLEDFFTEIVAHLFSTNKYLLFAWLKELNLLEPSDYADAQVLTQQSFDALPHHKSGSRPDIVIHLEREEGNSHDLIFIESKIGSHEGESQLSRYVDHLDSLQSFEVKTLLYVTRDFEPKTIGEVFKNSPESAVCFRQLRWYQLSYFLKNHLDIPLVQDILLFMKEKNMVHNNQFSSIDIIALSNFSSSLKLINQIMEGDISQRFNEVTGATNKDSQHQNKAMGEFKRYGRYYMVGDFLSKPYEFWCGLGFLLRSDSVTDYPMASLQLQVNPSSTHHEVIIKAMKSICSESNNWRGFNLNLANKWSSIARQKSLQDFLHYEDHVVAIKQYFLEVLDELEHLKKQYPELPWK